VSCAAVLLAAGGGSRWKGEGHKLLAPFRGSTIVEIAVGAALEAGLDETVVVSGAVDLSAAVPDSVTLLENEGWADGIATSLAVATHHARRARHDAIVVGLADQPLLFPSAWSAVAASTAPIAVATYDGHRRNPVRLSADVWDLLPITGDEGARVLMRLRPELVAEIPCEGEPADFDTVEDLERWS
jgi:CTP:molybdopterin cytidylyltransferase MocA